MRKNCEEKYINLFVKNSIFFSSLSLVFLLLFALDVFPEKIEDRLYYLYLLFPAFYTVSGGFLWIKLKWHQHKNMTSSCSSNSRTQDVLIEKFIRFKVGGLLEHYLFSNIKTPIMYASIILLYIHIILTPGLLFLAWTYFYIREIATDSLINDFAITLVFYFLYNFFILFPFVLYIALNKLFIKNKR